MQILANTLAFFDRLLQVTLPLTECLFYPLAFGNIGGSTELQFFRPPLKPGEAHWEAKHIRVEGNTFIGGGAAVAFVGVDGAVVRYNTIYHPDRWVIRILQETTEPGFVACRNGRFERNLDSATFTGLPA